MNAARSRDALGPASLGFAGRGLGATIYVAALLPEVFRFSRMTYLLLYYLYEMFAFFRWEIRVFFAMQLTFYGKVDLCNVTWGNTP